MTISIYEINNVYIHDVMNKEHQSNNTDGGRRSTTNATMSTTNST